MRVFIDTNLWTYRLDQREPAKSGRVHEWLAAIVGDCVCWLAITRS
jgi:predicted nucleic acid-binding protein